MLRNAIWLLIIPSGLAFLCSIFLMIVGAFIGGWEVITNVDFFSQRGFEIFLFGMMFSLAMAIVLAISIGLWVCLEETEENSKSVYHLLFMDDM